MEEVKPPNWLGKVMRLVGESKSTVQMGLLKKCGLAVHDIRCNLSEGTFPVTIASTRPGSLLDEGHWRLPVKLADLEVECVSKTEIFVDSVTVFAEIDNGSFQFLDTPSPKVVHWTEQFAKRDPEGTVTLPKLEPGVSRRAHFTAVEKIGPEPVYLANLLRSAGAEKEAVMGALLTMRLAGLHNPPEPCTSSSAKLASTLCHLSDSLAAMPKELRVTVVVALHDGTMALFHWTDGGFEKDFLTGGVTTV